MIATLPAAETVSVRIDPLLRVVAEPAGKQQRMSPGVLAFRRGGKETGRVEGDPQRLDLLETLLAGRTTDQAAQLVLPKSLDAYRAQKSELEDRVATFLAEGRELVEQVERLVCALYNVPDDLTEAVVEHAVARAKGSQPAED
jgi:hypothetical protein